MKNGLNGRIAHTTTYHCSKNSRGVPLPYFIIKDISSTKDSKKRYAYITHQEILVGNMFTSDSRKSLGVLKEPTLETDSKTWIKGLECDINAMQDPQAHNYGTSEGSQKQVAMTYVKKTFYNNDTPLHLRTMSQNIRGYLMCWINMVLHSIRSI